MKNFILTVNFETAKCNPDQLLSFIKFHKDISSWSVPYSGIYVFKSEKPIGDLRSSVEEMIGRVGYLIFEADPYSTGGRMAAEWWDWFNSDVLSADMVAAIAVNRAKKIGQEN